MKQEEFQMELKAIKEKRNEQVAELLNLKAETEQDLLHAKMERAEQDKRCARLLLQIKGINKQIDTICTRTYKKLQDFVNANEGHGRKLEDVSDWCLVNELKSRGYYADDLKNDERDADWLKPIADKFRNITPPTSLDTEQQHEEGSAA